MNEQATEQNEQTQREFQDLSRNQKALLPRTVLALERNNRMTPPMVNTCIYDPGLNHFQHILSPLLCLDRNNLLVLQSRTSRSQSVHPLL